MYEAYQQYLSDLDTKAKLRKLPVSPHKNGAKFLDFSTNDYLCLSKNEDVIHAARQAAASFGVGSTGSRLLSGNQELFEAFEAKIAASKGTEAALIFNSGYQANLSGLAALLDSKILGARPIVFFDKLNHGSLYQAIALSQAELVRFSHNNVVHLSQLLEKYRDSLRPKFIVTESIFGMDGDVAPLNEIEELAMNHNAFIYLDEAHATGVIGKNGYGLSDQFRSNDSKIIIGTFSKGLGGSGAYIACSTVVRDYLINKASGFVYSTANSPMAIASACKAWDLIDQTENLRVKLFSLADLLRERLREINLSYGKSSTHIVPIMMPSEPRTLEVRDILLDRGIIVSAIRPPTVPINQSRLRVALNASHTEDDVNRLAIELSQL
jgi:8-amino-7-oxononanoate synthase